LIYLTKSLKGANVKYLYTIDNRCKKGYNKILKREIIAIERNKTIDGFIIPMVGYSNTNRIIWRAAAVIAIDGSNYRTTDEEIRTKRWLKIGSIDEKDIKIPVNLNWLKNYKGDFNSLPDKVTKKILFIIDKWNKNTGGKIEPKTFNKPINNICECC
jgi:hypothetical protein